jgi:methionyl-tRNA formyltransferase
MKIALGVSGKLGEWVLDYLSKQDIVGVDTLVDQRGQTDCVEVIKRLNLPLKTYEQIVKEKPDLFISIGYVRKIGKDLLDQCLCVNLHSGKLPEYRGRNLFAHSIANGEKYHYMTLTVMTEDWDAGDIIGEIKVPIGEKDTCLDLYWKCQFAGLELFKEEFPKILNSTFQRRKQEGEVHYYTKELDKEVFFDQNVYDFVRSRQFPPYEPAYIKIGTNKIYLTI